MNESMPHISKSYLKTQRKASGYDPAENQCVSDGKRKERGCGLHWWELITFGGELRLGIPIVFI